MADEIKVKMSEFANATNVGDSDDIIILQNGENKKVKSPILEQKLIDKVVPKVSDEVKEIYTAPTPLYLVDETPTKDGIYIPMEYGTYTNGLTYLEEDGDVEFILKSEVWTKRIIPFVANGEVKEGDLRAVSGGEVYDYVKGVEDDLQRLFIEHVNVEEGGINGAFINKDTNLIVYNPLLNISPIISLKEGDRIEYSGGSGNVVSMIAEVVSDGVYNSLETWIQPADLRDYTWIAPKDIDIVISYSKSFGLKVSITRKDLYTATAIYMDKFKSVTDILSDETESIKNVLKGFENSQNILINGLSNLDESPWVAGPGVTAVRTVDGWLNLRVEKNIGGDQYYQPYSNKIGHKYYIKYKYKINEGGEKYLPFGFFTDNWYDMEVFKMTGTEGSANGKSVTYSGIIETERQHTKVGFFPYPTSTTNYFIEYAFAVDLTEIYGNNIPSLDESDSLFSYISLKNRIKHLEEKKNEINEIKTLDYILSKDNFVVKREGNNLFLSTDGGLMFTKELDISEIGAVTLFYLFENGEILIANERKIFYSHDWKTITESSVFGLDGEPFISTHDNTFSNPTKGKERHYSGSTEMYVWGNYSNLSGVQRTSNIRLWYTTDKGITVKCFYEFGRELLDGSALAETRHVHHVDYNPADDSFWVQTGDHGLEPKLIKANYELASDDWTFELIGEGQEFKFTNMEFLDEWIYISWDVSPGGVKKVKYADIRDVSEHELLFKTTKDCIFLVMNGHDEMLSFITNYGGTGLPRFIFYSNDGGATVTKIEVPIPEQIDTPDAFLYPPQALDSYNRILSPYRTEASDMSARPSVWVHEIVRQAGFPNAFKIKH